MKNAAIIALCIAVIAAYFVVDLAFCGGHHMAAAAEIFIG